MAMGSARSLLPGPNPSTTCTGNDRLVKRSISAMKPSSSRLTRLMAWPAPARPVRPMQLHGSSETLGTPRIDHVRQVVNVDAAGCDVGGHQGADVTALLKPLRAWVRALALVAVWGHRRVMPFFSRYSATLLAPNWCGEYPHLAPVLGLDDAPARLSSCRVPPGGSSG